MFRAYAAIHLVDHVEDQFFPNGEKSINAVVVQPLRRNDIQMDVAIADVAISENKRVRESGSNRLACLGDESGEVRDPDRDVRAQISSTATLTVKSLPAVVLTGWMIKASSEGEVATTRKLLLVALSRPVSAALSV